MAHPDPSQSFQSGGNTFHLFLPDLARFRLLINKLSIMMQQLHSDFHFLWMGLGITVAPFVT